MLRNMDYESHHEDAKIAIAELGPIATSIGSLGTIYYLCNWLGWPDWLRKDTSLTGSGPLPRQVSWADDLSIMANILDHADVGRLIDRMLDSPGALLDSSHAMLFENAPTLLEAVEVYAQSVNSLNPHLHAKVATVGQSLVYTLEPKVSLGRIMDFFGFTSCFTVFGVISGLKFDGLDQVRMRLTGSRELYGRAATRLSCEVEFACEKTALLIPNEWEKLARPNLEPSMWSLALQRVDAQRYGDAEIALAARVRQRVRDSLEKDSKVIKIEQIAIEERVSGRSIARLLEGGGTSFQQIVQLERRRLALNLIGDPKMPLQKISERLGFSEISSFSRAFKLWFGQSPTGFRRQKRR